MDGLVTPPVCAYSVMTVAECIGDESTNMCDGWCWAADRLGCGGDDCAADCQANQEDAACGVEWLDLLDCVLFFGDAECSDAGLIGNGICDSEMTAYQACSG
jgi:hypothetical protein